MPVQIQLRHGVAAAWTAANPVLALGEMGVETDTKAFKVGDGATPWNALPYSSGLTGLDISAGTTSSNRSDYTFANSNGVSFGLNGAGVITATVVTNYLTTAMASNRGTDFVQATAGFHGTNVSGTLASSGISVSVAPSAGSLNISAGTTSSAVSAVTFSNANGVSFGFDGSNVTATVQTNYLTTAMASNRGSDFVQATAVFNGTNASGTIASGAISVSVPATSSLMGVNGISISSNGSTISISAANYSDFVAATAGFFGTNASGTIASNAISVSVAAPTNNSINISAGTTSSNVTAVTFSNSNGVSFGYDGTKITATVKTDYLTTAMASNRGSDFVQATAAFHGTNASGTINSNDVSVSVANASNSSWTVSDANTSATVGRLAFTNSNGLTLSLSTSNNGNHTVIGSYTVPTVTNSSWTVSDSATSATVGRLAFTNGNGVSFALSTSNNGNQTISASVKTDYAGTVSGATNCNVTVNTAGVSVSVSAGTNSSWTVSDSATSATVGRLAFTASNGLTLTLSTSNNGNHTVIGSYTVPTVTNSSWTVSDSATSATVGRLMFSNANGVSFGLSTSNNGQQTLTATVQTNYLTTAALSSQTLAFSLGGNSGTTNSSQILNGGYILAGGNNVTINQSNNSVSISAGAINIANSQSTYSNSTVNLLEGGGAITIATSAGGQSFKFSVPQTSSLIGTNGISISTNGSTISVSYISTFASYFENMAFLDAASTTLSASGSVLQVVPFVLPYAVSLGFIRVPVSMSYVSTEVSGTTANSTWTVNRSYTDCAFLMTQKAGASSLSLGYLTSSQATWVFQNQIQAGANGSRYTVTQNVSYPISGTTSNYTTSYPQSSANVQISSASLTLFTGARWLDIPFGVSLSPGNYWLGLGRSTNSATQAGNVNLGAASAGFSYIGISQNNLSIGFPGAATNSSIALQPGLGSWSTNAAVMSTSSMAIASISAMSSGAKPYFQLIRYA